MGKTVITRFAPSPTGSLHIGGLRTAYINYLYAKKRGGKFLLRLEDTDVGRTVEGAKEELLENLRWTGLIDSNQGFDMVQSQQGDKYLLKAKDLIDSGYAYLDFTTKEELEILRSMPSGGGEPFSVSYLTRDALKTSLNTSREQIESWIKEGKPYCIRFKVSPTKSGFIEIPLSGQKVRTVSINCKEITDQVLIKSDGMPTYHLASIVDDHEMGVTHVIRGSEWGTSLPLHILLYKAFGWEPPTFFSIPLILKPDGKGKLSKRDRESLGIPVCISDFKEEGFEGPSLLNGSLRLGDPELRFLTHYDPNKMSSAPTKYSYKVLLKENRRYLENNTKIVKSFYKQNRTFIKTKVGAGQLKKFALFLISKEYTTKGMLKNLPYIFHRPTEEQCKELQSNFATSESSALDKLIEIFKKSRQMTDLKAFLALIKKDKVHNLKDVYNVLRSSITGIYGYKTDTDVLIKVFSIEEITKRLENVKNQQN